MLAERLIMSSGPNMAWYAGLSGRGMRLGLEDETELLERLGRPQDGIRLIHVAGTDGKGSVCAVMEAVLRESGYSVGMFTSPEILRINESIRIGGLEIEDADLEQIMGPRRAS